MSHIENKNIQPEGFSIKSQTPVDDRLIFTDAADIQDLGTNDYKAYTYYEGMRVWVISEEVEYIWKESGTGKLATSFTYPAGHIVNNVNYGGKSFNFTTATGSSHSHYYHFGSVDLTADVLASYTVTPGVGIDSILVLDSSGNNITAGVHTEIAGNIISIGSNVDLTGLTIKVIYNENV